MPTGSPIARAPRFAHRLGRLAASVVLLTPAGAAAACGTAATAGQSSGGHELIDDVAARLATGESTTYQASYALAGGGGRATVANATNPTRSSYAFPTGMVIVAGGQITQCDRPDSRATCTVAPAISGAQAADTAIERGGLIRPERVIALLSEAALDANAIVSERDTTIAGTPATCLTIGGAATVAQFSMCVTAAGLLGSFQGQETGIAVDVELATVATGVSPTAFLPPAGAHVAPASTRS
jgi:hypothetical protein